MIVSKIKNQNRITPYLDHTRSFDRGHPGGVDFDFVSLIH